jgi:phytol kinase
VLQTLLPAWLQPFLPTPDVALRVIPLALLYGMAAAALVGYLRAVRDVRTPYTRKMFHFAIFTMAGLVHLTWGTPGVVVYGSIIALIVCWGILRGEGYPFYEALARPSDRPRRTLFIIVPLVTTALGGVCANLLTPSLAFVGYLVCGWGDAVGEPVGTRWGVHRYRVPSLGGIAATRSLEGSAAVLIAGSLAAIVGLWLSGLPLTTAAYIGAAAGIAGAGVEAISNHGLDNFTVQVAAAGIAVLLLS